MLLTTIQTFRIVAGSGRNKVLLSLKRFCFSLKCRENWRLYIIPPPFCTLSKETNVNLSRADTELLNWTNILSSHFLFQVQSWSFLCLARKQLHLYCIVFPVLLWVPVSQVHNKERRTFREFQGRALTTTLLWLPSTDFCFFFNISCICCVYPVPTRTLSCHCKLKDKRIFVS